MPKRKGRKSSRRKVATRPQRKSIRAYSEGEVTEPCYLQMLNDNFPEVNIHWVEKDSGQAAVTLISAAKKYKKKVKTGDLPDQIWCIWDVDNLDEATIARLEDLGRAVGINNAISNPCFELWLLLHDRAHAAHIDINNVQSAAKAAGLIEGKEICCCKEWLYAQIEIAKARAERLEQGHVEAGSKKTANPSSGMHGLLQAVIDLKEKYDEENE